MTNAERLAPEVHEFLIKQIQEGITPSQALRKMHKIYGVQNLHEMCASLGDAYSVRPFDILVYLGHWWFDSSSDMTDEHLDSCILKTVEEIKNEYKNA